MDYYGLKIYDIGNRQYAVGTDSQADEACRRCIRDSLWAFQSTFISQYTPKGVDAEVICLIVEKKCEDANEAVATLIGDQLGKFIDDAIACDGREHFLSSWDGREVASDDIDGLPKGRVAFRIN